MNNLSPKNKTLIAISIFSLAALISFIMSLDALTFALPLFIFYVLLLINTFFSIKLFFGIIPENILNQKIIDGILAVLYIVLAFSFKNPLLFSYLLVLFFLISSAKYVLLIHVLHENPRLMRRKILANILGALLGLVILGGILAGYLMLSIWGLVAIFAIANVFLFFISPLYRLDRTA